MKVAVICPLLDEDEIAKSVRRKVAATGHKVVRTVTEADVLLVLVSQTNQLEAFSRLASISKIKPNIRVIILADEFPGLIFGALHVHCSKLKLNEALETMIKKSAI